MAKIDRKTQKILGSNSANNGVFGSAVLSGGVLSNDPDVIQSLPAWEGGWNPATISGEKLPALEELQGVEYVTTRQIAYLFQEGIPEWDADTEYHENSLVKESGTVKIYKSLTDDNKGNPLSDGMNWDMVVDFDNPSYTPPQNNYTATTDPTVTDDSSEGYSVGSVWYNTSGHDLFLCVNSSVGAADWQDTGVNLTDLGSAAFLNAGTSANNLVQLNGSGELPAVPGKNLTSLPIGSICAVYYSEYTSYLSVSAAIPLDDTTPLISEGVELLSITTSALKSSTNKLRVQFSTQFSGGGSVAICSAFINGGTNAIKSAFSYPNGSSAPSMLCLDFVFTPGSTSPVTIAIRIGTAGAAIAINGSTSGRLLGGAMLASLVVEEIVA